jgi:N-acylglucosamine-6-phosphate 2-epimerase
MTALDLLKDGLVVSCQPVENGPLDSPELVAALAAAAVAGGAKGVRIEGVENLQATRAAVTVPIIGIVKEDLPDSPVRITPRLSQVHALAEAGADVIAYDATHRARPHQPDALLERILSLGKIAMADCATERDGRCALEGGAHILGSTLSGYTDNTGPAGPEPDLALVTRFKSLGAFVMAEGRYNTPDAARAANRAGADCVTVGTALTRLEIMTQGFASAIENARVSCNVQS